MIIEGGFGNEDHQLTKMDLAVCRRDTKRGSTSFEEEVADCTASQVYMHNRMLLSAIGSCEKVDC